MTILRNTFCVMKASIINSSSCVYLLVTVNNMDGNAVAAMNMYLLMVS